MILSVATNDCRGCHDTATMTDRLGWQADIVTKVRDVWHRLFERRKDSGVSFFRGEHGLLATRHSQLLEDTVGIRWSIGWLGRLVAGRQ